MTWTFRAIDSWPWPFTPAHERKSKYVFRASWTSTRQLLERELRHVEADRAVLCVAVQSERDLRRDGTGPLADARVSHPGVILVADTRHGALRYATDAFQEWQDNVRAIALGLEALRKVDRYGLTRSGEQYRGFSALPTAGAGNRDDDIRLLSAWADLDPTAVRLDPAHAFRRAARKTHPDAGGDPAVYAALVAARDRLRAAQTVVGAT